MSGLNQRFTKPPSLNWFQGFESLPLRNDLQEWLGCHSSKASFREMKGFERRRQACRAGVEQKFSRILCVTESLPLRQIELAQDKVQATCLRYNT